MGWSRSLGDLVTDIQDRADLAGFTARHPAATIRRRLIESYQRLREWMTSAGSNYWVGGPYTLTGTPTQVEYGSIYPLYSNNTTAPVWSIEHVRRLEGFYLSRWHEVPRVTDVDADKWSNYQYAKYPLEFYHLGRGNLQMVGGSVYSSESPDDLATTPDGKGQLRVLVMPYPGDGSCPLRVYGMPNLTISDADNVTLNLDAAGFDWLIYHTATKLIVRDNDSQGTYQIIKNELAAAEQIIRDSISREISVPVRRRDVFDISDRYRYRRGL